MNTKENIQALVTAFNENCQHALRTDVLQHHVTIGVKGEQSENSMLHALALAGILHVMPKRLRTLKNLKVKNSAGTTVFDLACDTNPNQLIGFKMPVRYKSILGDRWWSRNEASLARVTTHSVSVLPRSEVLRRAASNGFLFALKLRYLKKRSFLASPAGQPTALQEAAVAGYLDQVPRVFLTESNLMHENGKRNALGLAYDNGHLDQLLGIKLSQRCRPSVGYVWWEKNQKHLTAKPRARVRISKKPSK